MSEAIEQVLAERAGFDADALGKQALRRAVAARMDSCGISDPAAYLHVLRGSKGELDSLVEELTVLETWFFRDRGPFEFLQQFAWERGCVRVLSAPCATGEEPYSIAISLLDAGLPADRFHIDACDISRRALQAAARAIYGAASFREKWGGDRARWFHPAAQGYALRRDVAALVHFHREDLLHPLFLCAQAPYDVVFCRNLLIYLRPEAQSALIDRMGALLRPDGVAIAGHAEVAALLRLGYEAVSSSRCFACRKRASANMLKPAREPARHSVVPPLHRLAPAPAPECPPVADRGRLLHWARRLADEGALEDAWSLCEELLAREADAEAYYLEGLISAARDRLAQAEESFRRALYLDPAHYESLVQMSLVCERRGEPARAGLYRERAARRAGATEAIDARRP